MLQLRLSIAEIHGMHRPLIRTVVVVHVNTCGSLRLHREADRCRIRQSGLTNVGTKPEILPLWEEKGPF